MFSLFAVCSDTFRIITTTTHYKLKYEYNYRLEVPKNDLIIVISVVVISFFDHWYFAIKNITQNKEQIVPKMANLWRANAQSLFEGSWGAIL